MQETFRKLSDVFFIAGTLCTGLGVLRIVSAVGGFDGLAYIFYSLGVRMSGSETKWNARKSFSNFRTERHEKARKPKRLIAAGVIALGLAVVFAVLY